MYVDCVPVVYTFWNEKEEEEENHALDSNVYVWWSFFFFREIAKEMCGRGQGFL